jgi:hypothetical protein
MVEREEGRGGVGKEESKPLHVKPTCGAPEFTSAAMPEQPARDSSTSSRKSRGSPVGLTQQEKSGPTLGQTARMGHPELPLRVEEPQNAYLGFSVGSPNHFALHQR